MGPKDYSFWDLLMDEQGVAAGPDDAYIILPGGWCVPKDQAYESFKESPDFVYEEVTGHSQYDNGNVIMGEIVED